MDGNDRAIGLERTKNTVLLTIDRGWEIFGKSWNLQASSDPMVQLVRSLVVSVVALAGDAIILMFAKESVGIHYLHAAALGFLMGVIINYVLSANWVFATRKLDSKHAELTIFIAICVTGLILNLIIIGGLVERLGFDYRLAKLFSTALVFFWNFILRKKLLY